MTEAPLGRESAYPERYDAGLLFPIARAANRQPLGFDDASLPFVGGDEWWAFELSWLDPRGKPVVAVARFRLPADSPKLIESKSWKLYLNSFNQTTFADSATVIETLERDLGAAAEAPVTAELFGVDDSALAPQPMPGESIDALEVDIDCYTPTPALLACDDGEIVSETLHSHLLKSNCPVTGQPDWGSVLIQYEGPRLDRAALLRYLVSYRQHQDFHEHCVEHIFVDLMARCCPEKLLVMARYVRRGGLDISPWRATPGYQPALPARLLRQ
nr:NADPH-dependent 7-cyano-7-deazaguanine reductase QueF [Salinicola sp. S1-1-2]